MFIFNHPRGSALCCAPCHADKFKTKLDERHLRSCGGVTEVSRQQVR